MTTIAYDGSFLAVDRAGWKSNYTFYECDKLFDIPVGNQFHPHHGYCAFAGDEGEAVAILDWLLGRKPHPEIHEKGQSKGLFVTSGGEIYNITSALTIARVYTIPWVDGGGADFVLGAMSAGKTAPQAVELCARHTTWAAIGMDYVNVRTGLMGRTMF